MTPVPPAPVGHPVIAAATVAPPAAGLAADLSDPSARIVAALHEAHASSGLRAAMVTGAGTAEDNTLVAATLARALSDVLPRVLLIDIAGSPTLETCIGARLDADGSEWSHTRWQSLPISEVTPHLSVATAERLAPPRGFTSERLGAVLDNCSIFDFVVICAPPVPALPDPAQLARYAGAVVFVLSARAPFSANERAMTQVGRATIVGTMLSGVPGDQPDTRTRTAPVTEPPAAPEAR
jgi:Mrp family chromosome partitioning ATPase